MPRSDDFDDFYRRYWRPLLGFCIHVFKNLDAEEIAQEAMARAWARFDDLDPGRDPWPWLATIARNTGYDLFRSQRRLVAVDGSTIGELMGEMEPPADRAVLAEETRREVVQALGELTEQQRRLVSMRHLEERSCTDIAADFELSANALRQKLFRSCSAFRVAYLRIAGPIVGLVPAAFVALRRLARKLAPAGAVPVAALTAATAVVAIVVAGALGPGATAERAGREQTLPGTVGGIRTPFAVRDVPQTTPRLGSPGAQRSGTDLAIAAPGASGRVYVADDPTGTGVLVDLDQEVDLPIFGPTSLGLESEVDDDAQRPLCDGPLAGHCGA